MTRSRNFGRLGLNLWMIGAGICLVAPMLVVFVVSFTTSQYISFPSHGLTLKWWFDGITSGRYLGAAATSLVLATATVLGDLVLGVPASIAIVRLRPRGTGLARLVMSTPLIVPEILTALGLLTFFSLYGISNPFLRLYIGHLLITFPYVMELSAAALYRFDERQEWAAKSLGASGLQAFRHVTLPQIAPELLAGCLFAFIVSWNNAGLSIFLSGASVTVLPAALFFDLEYNVSPAVVAVSAELILVSVVAASLAHRVFALETVVGQLRARHV